MYSGTLPGVTLGSFTSYVPLRRGRGRFEVKAESSRTAAGEYRVLATRLESRMREHRALLRDVCPAGAALVAEKRDFAWFFYVEVDKVQREAKRREEQCSVYHDPRDQATERWLADCKLNPSRMDQPEDQGSLGRAEVEAALFLNNPEARLVRRVRVKELRGGGKDRPRAEPGGEFSTRMRVASQDFRGIKAR